MEWVSMQQEFTDALGEIGSSWKHGVKGIFPSVAVMAEYLAQCCEPGAVELPPGHACGWGRLLAALIPVSKAPNPRSQGFFPKPLLATWVCGVFEDKDWIFIFTITSLSHHLAT